MKEIHEMIENHGFTFDTKTMYTKITDFCEHPENEEITPHGLLQIILFYIDIYSVHADANTLKQITSLFDDYHEYVQKIEGDYSFGKGKLGFLYAATRLYELDKSSSFLEKATVFLEERMLNFISSPYTNNSIFTGRAGSLLVLEYYYAVTNDSKAKEWIDTITQKIISEAQVTDKGVFWKDRVEKMHGLLNFEFGNAGIGYTFLQLSKTYQNDDFQLLANLIYKYQSQFWDATIGFKATKKGIENNNTYQAALKAIQQEESSYFEPVLDIIFIHVGVTKFTLHLWQTTDDDSIKENALQYVAFCKQLIEKSNTTLSTKKALLLGTLFLEASKILQEESYKTVATSMADFIKEHHKKTENPSFTDCVFEIKIAHFYLSLENASVDNALLPKYSVQDRKNIATSIDVNCKEGILKNTFPRTFTYLQSHNNELISNYLKTPLEEKSMRNFMMFIKKNLNQFPSIQKKQLSEILKLEITIQNLKKSIKNYAQLEAKNIHTYQTVQALFNEPTEVLLSNVLQLNPTAKKLTTAWNWEQKQGVISTQKLQQPESNINVFLFPYYTHIIKEYWQHSHNVVLHYFENQTRISDAIAQIKQFYLSKDEIFIDSFSQFVMAETSYVLENLDTIILKIIQEYMAIGLLEIVQTSKSRETYE
ncbi:lanthionine synthetase LanC family protein [Kordia jejudonensis]|uniref:lanthionine synthetase LanC family protein n=1 Tax=Kordia jejudonensis TaxID=1348245 RepID=UPI00062986EB|nr:lanthionine synthetase LanC family protein [Kordia jejudonensis]